MLKGLFLIVLGSGFDFYHPEEQIFNYKAHKANYLKKIEFESYISLNGNVRHNDGESLVLFTSEVASQEESIGEDSGPYLCMLCVHTCI